MARVFLSLVVFFFPVHNVHRGGSTGGVHVAVVERRVMSCDGGWEVGGWRWGLGHCVVLHTSCPPSSLVRHFTINNLFSALLGGTSHLHQKGIAGSKLWTWSNMSRWTPSLCSLLVRHFSTYLSSFTTASVTHQNLYPHRWVSGRGVPVQHISTLTPPLLPFSTSKIRGLNDRANHLY